MPWTASACDWLVYSAILSFVILALGSGAVLLCREPARRRRIIELALLGGLVAPWLALIPGYPQLVVGWWPASPRDRSALAITGSIEQVAAPAAGQGPGSVVGPQTPGVGGAAQGLSRVQSCAGPDNKSIAGSAPPLDFGSWLVGLYLFGVAMGLAWWLVGVAALARLIRDACLAPLRCRRLLAEIGGRGSERVRLLASRRARQPFASVGVAAGLRPKVSAWQWAVIVLPEDLCGDDQGTRWALAHEWAHVEHRDFRAWFVANLARVVLYYQPLVWWLRRELRLCQDFMADARASREAPQPEDYAEFLAHRAAAGSPRLALAGLGMGFRRSELYARVAMLLREKPLESRAPRFWSVLVGVAALGLVGLLPALCCAPVSIAPPAILAAAPPDARTIALVVGPKWFAGDNRVVIQEVWSRHGSLRPGDTVTVRGTCVLASRPAASLLMTVTSNASEQRTRYAEKQVRAGTTAFQLELPIQIEGWLHVYLYDQSSRTYLGNVYFGTSAQMREIARWNLEKWMSQGA